MADGFHDFENTLKNFENNFELRNLIPSIVDMLSRKR